MSEYYGAPTTPTDSFLAHYGVRGMKWGVRRAKMTGNAKKLSRAHERALKKLAKLNAKADIETQANKAKKFNKIAKTATKIGAAGASAAIVGTGTNHTLHYINTLHKKIAKSKLDDIDRKAAKDTDEALGMYGHNNSQFNSGKISKKEWDSNNEAIDSFFNDSMKEYDTNYNKTIDDFNKGKNKRKTAADIGRYVGYIGAGVGGIGLGTAAVAKGKAMIAKHRTTEKGHAKAVAKRDAWRNQMDEVFAGTKYQGQYTHPSNKKKRRSRNG